MYFLQTPNLPERDVTLVVTSGTYPIIINALHKFEIEVIETRPCQNLSKPVSCHADMLIHHLGNNQVVVANAEEYLKNRLLQNGFNVIPSNAPISNVYPNDVPLNAVRIGEKLIANVAALDDTVIGYCEQNKIPIIPVKQGYTKCSTVVVDDYSIITADKSIAKAANTAGIDVLQITPGFVELSGYDYGFLGGACGMIGKNALAFTGNIKNHPEYMKIKSFCRIRKVELISLTSATLIDVGGIIPLKIKSNTLSE